MPDETKWPYVYDGKVQRVQIGDVLEDGYSTTEITPRLRLHLDSDDSLMAVEILDEWMEWE